MVEGNKEIVLKMNVSSFKPEDLKINLDGKRLTVEGSMKQETEHGVTERYVIRDRKYSFKVEYLRSLYMLIKNRFFKMNYRFKNFRSFVRSYLLPESADLQGIKSTLSDEGELLVAVPKADRKGMSIPIERIQKHALEEGRAPENEEEKNA